MRRLAAAVLLTTVLVSSLPCEFEALPVSVDAHSLQILANSPDEADPPLVPPATESCFCLCVGGPGSAVEGVSTFSRLAAAVVVVRTSTIPPDQTHTSEVLSRLFRPPRSA